MKKLFVCQRRQKKQVGLFLCVYLERKMLEFKWKVALLLHFRSLLHTIVIEAELFSYSSRFYSLFHHPI